MDPILCQNYINGIFENSTSKYIDSINPSTGNVWAKIPNSDSNDVEKAVKSAKTAFRSWSKLTPSQRAKYILAAADCLESRFSEFALAESKDQGKPVHLCEQMDIPRSIHNLRSFAEAWQYLTDTSNCIPGTGTVNYSVRKPFGVVGIITPWNLPLYLLTFKIAPALMSGNTAICKPSELTTVTAWMLMKIFEEIGLPPGVLNLVCGIGDNVGESLVSHPDVKVISFTGSTVIGQKIGSLAGPMMKKLSLELGGKNAAIVFEDAKLDETLSILIRSSFLNQGEICLCTSRIFIHESIYNEVKEEFVKMTQKLTVGDPNDAINFIGALISDDHLQENGGTVEMDDTEVPRIGYFIRPTIITGLRDDSRCMQEEIFGPVVCLTSFKTESEVIDRANNVPYGLCASVFTQDVGKAHRVAEALDVGTVWINSWLIRSLVMPFGGTKASGINSEGLTHSLDTFTEQKTISLKISLESGPYFNATGSSRKM